MPVLISEYSSSKPEQLMSVKKRIEKMIEVSHKNLVGIYSVAVVEEGNLMLVAL